MKDIKDLDESGLWIVWIVVLAVVSMLVSTLATAFKILNRVRLQEACEDLGDGDRAGIIASSAMEMASLCSFYRAMINTALVLVSLVWISRMQGHTPGAAMLLLAGLAAVVILAVCSVAVPQAIARYRGERIIARTYGAMRVIAAVSLPVVIFVRGIDALTRRLAGVVETPEESREEKEEEFLNVVEQGKMEGIVDEEQQEMIENVLELSDTTAEKIMTPRTDIVAVGVDASFQKVLDAIATGHSRIPVYDGTIDNILGFLYAKDMLAEIGKKPEEFNIRQRMRPAYFVPETKPLRILLHEFQNQKLHIAVVLDEYGGTAGLVTIEDILEELVGEIADEYEELPPQVMKRIDENTVEVDARIHIDELNSEFEVELPEDEDYDTLGGFVFSHLGYIPKTGESFEWHNLKFVIASAETRKINRIRIQKMPEVSGRHA